MPLISGKLTMRDCRQDHSKASLIFWYIASPSISSVQCPNISSSFLRRLLQLSSRNLTTSCGRGLRRGREILFLWAGVYSKKGRWIGTINGLENGIRIKAAILKHIWTSLLKLVLFWVAFAWVHDYEALLKGKFFWNVNIQQRRAWGWKT